MARQFILLCIASAFIAGCGGPEATETSASGAAPTETSASGVAPITAEDRAAIEANGKLFAEAFKAGESDKLAALYTEDAVVYPPDEPAVTGREEIAKTFAAFPPVKDFTEEILEIEGYGDMAYVRGTGVMTMAGPTGQDVVMRGKYIEIHRKQADGSWLMSRDIFNFDSPMR
jgi:uncharacterized protein (TIGR02246 family)